MPRETCPKKRFWRGVSISVDEYQFWERSDADPPNPLFYCSLNVNLDGRDFHSRRGVFSRWVKRMAHGSGQMTQRRGPHKEKKDSLGEIHQESAEDMGMRTDSSEFDNADSLDTEEWRILLSKVTKKGEYIRTPKHRSTLVDVFGPPFLSHTHDFNPCVGSINSFECVS